MNRRKKEPLMNTGMNTSTSMSMDMSMDSMDLDLDLVIATVAPGRPPTFVAIVGPPQSGKSSIADLFKGIHLPRPTVRDGFIDHWNDTPCCKIIDTTVALSNETVHALSSFPQHRLRTRHMYKGESYVVPSSVAVTMSPEQYQSYRGVLCDHIYVGLGGLTPVITWVRPPSP